MEWSAKAVAGVLVAGKHCSLIASLVCSSLEQVKLLLDCSDQVWLKLLNLASTHGSISPQNCNMLRDVCQHSLANLSYYWVMIRKLGKDRFFCQGMTPATSDQLIQYYEAHLE